MPPQDDYRRLEVRLDDIAEVQRRNGDRIAALEDRTTGQRTRLAAIEESYSKIYTSLGRMQDRGDDCIERLLTLERKHRDAPAASPPTLIEKLSDVKMILLWGVLIGLTLGKSGIDVTALFK